MQIRYAWLRISKLYYNPRGRGTVRFAVNATLSSNQPKQAMGITEPLTKKNVWSLTV